MKQILSDSELETIKDKCENLIDIEIIEELKKQKGDTSRINIGKLFLKCHNWLDNSLILLGENDKGKLKKYLDSFKNKELRISIEDYGDGKKYGSYIAGEKIKDLVDRKWDKMNELIKLFFQIFEE